MWLNCDFCGKKFFKKFNLRMNHHFCCHKCSSEYRKSLVDVVCEICGETYKIKAIEKNRGFYDKACSYECFRKSIGLKTAH
jgi:hypothetical protein